MTTAPILDPYSPDDPSYGVGLTSDDDLPLRPGCYALVLDSNPHCPEVVRVEKLLATDEVVVSNVVFRSVRRREALDNLRLVLCMEAVEVD